jgi:hypothetical protein
MSAVSCGPGVPSRGNTGPVWFAIRMPTERPTRQEVARRVAPILAIGLRRLAESEALERTASAPTSDASGSTTVDPDATRPPTVS